MAIDINLERPSATNVAAQAESVRENLGAIASTPAPILGSSSLSVTSGLATDLEKLVAQVISRHRGYGLRSHLKNG